MLKFLYKTLSQEMNNDEGTYLSMPLFDAKSAICHQLLTAAAATLYAFASVGEAIKG